MAARTTTAPTLTYILDQREAGDLEPRAQRLGDEARAELRALLRVARAAQRLDEVMRDCVNVCSACGSEDELRDTDFAPEMHEALAALARVSGRQRKGGR